MTTKVIIIQMNEKTRISFPLEQILKWTKNTKMDIKG